MSNEKNLSNKNFKDLSEYQVNVPVSLEKLNCSYHEFISWLKNYPETTGKYRNTIKLNFKETGNFEIYWSTTLDTPGYESIDFPLFDGFSFDVVSVEPLTLIGQYSYLNIKKPRKEVYSEHAKDFLDLVNRHFGQVQTVNIDPTDERILKLLKDDITLTDSQIGQKLAISRQNVNSRRRALQKAGYKVR